jgi:Protein of unknown function (DUF1559)/Domain of unknown function (DUF4190)
MIRFTCPCGKSLSANDEHAGETTRCPDCERELTIPDDEGVQAGPISRDPADDGIRQSRPGRDAAFDERPSPATTSGMAITSTILGVLSLILCSVFTGVPAIILGGLGLGVIGRSNGRLKGKGLAITGIVTGGLSLLLLPVIAIGLLLPAVSKVREAAARLSNINNLKVREAAARINNMHNLKVITLVLNDYDAATGTLPPAAICDPKGKHLLSWRVAILPYMEAGALYNQFKLDEPWDGPNNSKLIARMPMFYALPSDKTAPPGSTYYRVFVGNGAAFDWCKGAKMPDDFKDGTSNTILVVEAAMAAPWTKPDELDFDPNQPPPPLGGHFPSGAAVGMANGSVRQIPKTVSSQTLKAAITRSGGDVLGPDW